MLRIYKRENGKSRLKFMKQLFPASRRIHVYLAGEERIGKGMGYLPEERRGKERRVWAVSRIESPVSAGGQAGFSGVLA